MHLPRVIIDAKLFCQHCGARHVDESRNGEKWHRRAHTTHRCQKCGKDWDVYVSGAPDEAADTIENAFQPAPTADVSIAELEKMSEPERTKARKIAQYEADQFALAREAFNRWNEGDITATQFNAEMRKIYSRDELLISKRVSPIGDDFG